MLLTVIASLLAGAAPPPDIALLPLDLPAGQLSADEESAFKAIYRGEVEGLNLSRAGWVAVEQAFKNAGRTEARCTDRECMVDIGKRLGVKRVVRIRVVPYAGPRLLIFSLIANVELDSPDEELQRDYAKDERIPLIETFRNGLRHTLGELRLEREELASLTEEVGAPRAVSSDRGPSRFVAIGLAGAGVLALGGGVFSHLAANARSADLAALRSQSRDQPLPSTLDGTRLIEERDGARLRAGLLYGAGVALLAGGAWLFVRAEPPSQEVSVSVAVGPTGVALVGAWP